MKNRSIIFGLIIPITAIVTLLIVLSATTNPSFDTNSLPTQYDVLPIGVAYYQDVNNATAADSGSLFFEVKNITGILLFQIDSGTGILTNSSPTSDWTAGGSYLLRVGIGDGDGTNFYFWNFSITTANTAPQFNLSVTNKSFEILEDVNYTINLTNYISDIEDTDKQLNFSISVNNTDLLSVHVNNETNIIILDPAWNRWGLANITINVTDTMGLSNTSSFNITILAVQDPPFYIFYCNNLFNNTESLLVETNTTLDEGKTSTVNCFVNATDPDNSTELLSFMTNYSWFTFNNSKNIYTVAAENNNASVQFDFELNDSHVGSWRVNFSVNDSTGLTGSYIINFTVGDAKDQPLFVGFNTTGLVFETYAFAPFSYNLSSNVSDDDFMRRQGENITYLDNSSLFDINLTRGVISFKTTSADVGTHRILVNITDSTGLMNYTIINLTVYSNNPPYFTISPLAFNVTEGYLFEFNLSTNATDPDSETFNFTHNASNIGFYLGVLGNISVKFPDSQVGTHMINVTLSDVHGALNTTIFNFTVYNENDPPYWDSSDIYNPGVNENTTLSMNIDAFDNDTNLPLSIRTEYLNFTVNNSLFTIVNTSATRAKLNFTPNFTQASQSIRINITVTDSTSLNGTAEFTVTVVNTAPTVTIGQLAGVSNHLFTYDVNCSNHPETVLNFSLNTTAGGLSINRSNGLVSFTPDTSFEGLHSIRVNVTDNYGAINSTVVNLTIYPNSAPTCSSFASFYNDDDSFPYDGTFSVNENRTTIFHFSGCTDYEEASTEDNLTFELYWNGIYNGSYFSTYPEWVTKVFTWNYTVFFNQNGTRNATILVTDGFLNVSYSWSITVNQVAAPPILNKTIGEWNGSAYIVEWNQGSSQTLNMSQYFIDYDEENACNLNYNWTTPDNIGVTPSGGSNGNCVITLNNPTWSGENNITFTANDSVYSKNSNLVILRVKPVATQTVTTTVSSSSSRTVYQNLGLDIIIPSLITMPSLSETLVPVVLRNSGNIDFSTVDLSAFSNETGLDLILEENIFKTIKAGEEKTAMLRVKSGLLAPERYTIDLKANAQNPKMEKQIKLFIDITEQDADIKSSLTNEMNFIRDLFLQNPECLELSELVDRASKLMDEGKYEESRMLLRNANEACKDFLTKQKITGRLVKEQPVSLLDWRVLAVEGLFVLMIISILIHYYKIRRFKKSALLKNVKKYI